MSWEQYLLLNKLKEKMSPFRYILKPPYWTVYNDGKTMEISWWLDEERNIWTEWQDIMYHGCRFEIMSTVWQ